MTSALMKTAGKSVLSQQLQTYAPTDPYYETYLDPQSQKSKRRPRGLKSIPEGLSSHDARILLTIRKRAHRLDAGFTLCGIRFGWTFFIGLIPVVGDLADFTLNHFLVVKKAEKGLGIPKWMVRKMMTINAFSAVIGSVPLLGDVLIAIWKANSRNVRILEEYLVLRGEEYLKLREEGLSIEDILAIPTDDEEAKATTGEPQRIGRRRDKKRLRPGHGVKRGEIVPGDTPRAGEEVNTASDSTGFFGSLFGSNGRKKTTAAETAAGNQGSAITMKGP